MSIWPRSLRAQTITAVMAIVVLSQIMTLGLVTFLVLRPQLNHMAHAMAQNVAVLSRAIDAVPPEGRAGLIKELEGSAYIDLWTGDVPPDRSGPPPRPMERIFMNALANAMHDQQDHLQWRTDYRRKLWVQVIMGGEPYWISLKTRPLSGPNGAIISMILIAVGLATLITIFLTVKVLRPLNQLRVAADGFRLSSMPATLSEDGPSEIASLSRSFNAMTRRLEQADKDRTFILAGISHDLRTPLAKLGLALEMADIKDEALHATASRQIETIDRILSQFMEFARGFAAEKPALIDPKVMLDDILRNYGSAGVMLGNYAAAAPFTARSEAIRRAFINLIENALNYGCRPVTIGISRVPEGIALIVKDQGNGIAPDLIEALKQPFARGNVARSPGPIDGTGLGLALVEQVAQLHGGTLQLQTLEHGGFEARLILANA